MATPAPTASTAPKEEDSTALKKTKVFIGNLAFKTTEDELKKAFAHIGAVADANIIMRGTRSLGYGFVEFENEADAQKAVKEMNKTKLDDREINVELANPRDESAGTTTTTSTAGGTATGAGPGAASAPRGRGRGGLRGRGRGTRGGTRGGAATTTTSTATATSTPAGAGRARGRGRGRGGPPTAVTTSTPGSTAPTPAGSAPPAAGNAAKVGRARSKPQSERLPSNTMLFVANLPFSLDDDGLKKIFEGRKIKSAHVVRKHNSKSKGFGFVDFENNEEQKAALALAGKVEVEGREITIKVALQAEGETAADLAAEHGGNDAPADETKPEGGEKKADAAATPATKDT